MNPKALDPATRYATDVCDGKIVASASVRLACRRHLEDLKNADARGLMWDAEKAQLAIDFFPDILCLPEDTDSDDEPEAKPAANGTPFVLAPWQQFIVGSLMGWFAYRTNKKGVRRLSRRFRVAFIEGAKGCGKTPLCAGLLIYLLVADGERGAQMFCAAVTKDQAKIAFADCQKMIAASPHLKEAVQEFATSLSVKESGSFIRPISSEKRGLDGKRVHGACIDEEHEHRTDEVYLKVRAGTKGRRNALIMVPTNSGFDKETVCGRHHDYSQQVLAGTIKNDAWFAFVCHLDPCEKCAKDGKLQPSDDCPKCDDWKVEGQHWLKANPNLGVSLTWQYLREQVREAIDIPSQRNMVRRLNFCQWTQQADVWIPLEKWTDCKGLIGSLAERECFIGVDLSDKLDLSSVVAVFPRPLERGESVKTADGQDIDRAIDVLAFFWMPERTAHQRAEEDGVPYPTWAAEKHITLTPGYIIDHDAIADFVISELGSKYHIRGIGVDQAGATAFVTRLQRHFGDEIVVEVPQGFRSLNDPSKTVEALIVSRNVQHDGNPVMSMCIGNMGKEENHWREIRPVKLSMRKRIDGGVALIDGVYVMQRTPSAEEPGMAVLTW